MDQVSENALQGGVQYSQGNGTGSRSSASKNPLRGREEEAFSHEDLKNPFLSSTIWRQEVDIRYCTANEELRRYLWRFTIHPNMGISRVAKPRICTMKNQGIPTVRQRGTDRARRCSAQFPGRRPQACVAKLLMNADTLMRLSLYIPGLWYRYSTISAGTRAVKAAIETKTPRTWSVTQRSTPLGRIEALTAGVTSSDPLFAAGFAEWGVMGANTLGCCVQQQPSMAPCIRGSLWGVVKSVRRRNAQSAGGRPVLLYGAPDYSQGYYWHHA
ncbi:hypothetical protein BC827DRAFT_1155235 [Russula dissimulans]|nr:hypothetical protein BC827DRAFT_1155235 [Russula dissimulans]